MPQQIADIAKKGHGNGTSDVFYWYLIFKNIQRGVKYEPS
jgi:hypothetical protein